MYNEWVGLVTLALRRHFEEVIVMRWILDKIQSWFSVFALIVIGANKKTSYLIG
jgi:hypothetical protein